MKLFSTMFLVKLKKHIFELKMFSFVKKHKVIIMGKNLKMTDCPKWLYGGTINTV